MTADDTTPTEGPDTAGVADRVGLAVSRAREGVASAVGGARQKVDALRDDRARRALHTELGELYHRAITAGDDRPPASELEPVLAALAELEDDDPPDDGDDDE